MRWIALTALLATPGPSGPPEPECGAHCLYVALRALDVPAKHDEVKDKLGPLPPGGYSLGSIEEVAQGYGLEMLGVTTSVENLRLRPERFACIAHLSGNHFVLLAAAPEEGPVRVIDPPKTYDLPAETLATRWDGTALLLSPDPLIKEEDLPRPVPWLWTLVGVLAGAVFAMGLVLVARRRR